jgi:hypothetical protein
MRQKVIAAALTRAQRRRQSTYLFHQERYTKTPAEERPQLPSGGGRLADADSQVQEDRMHFEPIPKQ